MATADQLLVWILAPVRPWVRFDVGLFLCSWCLFCENLRENDQALARWQFVSTCCIVDEHGGLVAVGLGEFLD